MNLPRAIFPTLALAAACLAAVACASAPTAAPGSGSGITPVSPGRTVSFAADVAPMLQNHCASCHAAGGRAARDGTYFDANGNALFSAISSAQGRIVSDITSRRMPEGGDTVSGAELGLLTAWVSQGMPNN